jgi:hypothetical protein
MNIFVLSRNVRTCARMHCDQHVVKMPLETAQLLSTALHELDPERWKNLRDQGLAYKPTHVNHPCAIWARACINNYLWLAALGLELCQEYSYRFGGENRKRHKCEAVLVALKENAPQMERLRCITPFALAMPEEFVSVADPVSSYRSYYLGQKLVFARWTRRPEPDWVTAGRS